MISRRDLLQRGALGLAGMVAPSLLRGQEPPAGIVDSSNLFAMDQSAARSVRLPRKPGATPSMSVAERDDLEHRIRCQCGCTLDVYICRTTDFSCQVSPSMHRDIMALVDGGYTAEEILEEFVNVYGERVLMAPPREGFNLVGYMLPASAIAVGAVVLAVIVRRWRRTTPAGATPTSATRPLEASAEELRQLEAAVRDDS
ncbi:MAG: cytochrome c-type biogenesis protein [Gemmatimonadaceae bacterium]